ncbi:MAG: peptidoglycan-binding protein [Candidatus Omnitrophica bacterium]|nr:peptidoglycan-binding protein [Candidatus Omnitrophota bacterium]
MKQAAVYLNKKDEQSKIIGDCLSSLDCKKKIQLALKSSGFDPGAIDGKIGPKTRKAITNFQKAKGLKADGDINIKTWEVLSKYFPKP